jgi:hypothetical protein
LGSPLLPCTAVLWMQGEAEAKSTQMPPSDYARHFHDIVADLRANGVVAPVFPAVTTLCEAGEPPYTNAPAIREAQLSLPNPAEGVFAGPETDSVGREFRFDCCHFSAAGLDRCADLWLATLARHWPLLAKPSIGVSWS